MRRSGHKTAQSYRGYAKETFDVTAATPRKLSIARYRLPRQRHNHQLANKPELPKHRKPLEAEERQVISVNNER